MTGWTPAARRIDLTADASWELITNSTIASHDGGYFVPRADGVATYRVSAAGKETLLRIQVSGTDTKPRVSFIRHVMPLINKAGCTSGSCHGAAKGKRA